jgi:hypothetical protein
MKLANATNLDRKSGVGQEFVVVPHFAPPQSDFGVRSSRDGKEGAW